MKSKEMAELCEHHMRVELDADLEGLMATLSANPVWGHPEGPKIIGRDAVRAHYEGILKPGRHEARRLHTWTDEENQQAASEYTVGVHLDDGSYVEFPVLQIVSFDGKLISSERLYYDPERPPVDHTGKPAG